MALSRAVLVTAGKLSDRRGGGAKPRRRAAEAMEDKGHSDAAPTFCSAGAGGPMQPALPDVPCAISRGRSGDRCGDDGLRVVHSFDRPIGGDSRIALAGTGGTVDAP